MNFNTYTTLRDETIKLDEKIKADIKRYVSAYRIITGKECMTLHLNIPEIYIFGRGNCLVHKLYDDYMMVEDGDEMFRVEMVIGIPTFDLLEILKAVEDDMLVHYFASLMRKIVLEVKDTNFHKHPESMEYQLVNSETYGGDYHNLNERQKCKVLALIAKEHDAKHFAKS